MDFIIEIVIRMGIIYVIIFIVCFVKVWKKSNQILEIRSRKDSRCNCVDYVYFDCDFSDGIYEWDLFIYVKVFEYFYCVFIYVYIFF